MQHLTFLRTYPNPRFVFIKICVYEYTINMFLMYKRIPAESRLSVLENDLHLGYIYHDVQ